MSIQNFVVEVDLSFNSFIEEICLQMVHTAECNELVTYSRLYVCCKDYCGMMIDEKNLLL